MSSGGNMSELATLTNHLQACLGGYRMLLLLRGKQRFQLHYHVGSIGIDSHSSSRRAKDFGVIHNRGRSTYGQLMSNVHIDSPVVNEYFAVLGLKHVCFPGSHPRVGFLRRCWVHQKWTYPRYKHVEMSYNGVTMWTLWLERVS